LRGGDGGFDDDVKDENKTKQCERFGKRGRGDWMDPGQEQCEKDSNHGEARESE
jgi:hypothetical protein